LVFLAEGSRGLELKNREKERSEPEKPATKNEKKRVRGGEEIGVGIGKTSGLVSQPV